MAEKNMNVRIIQKHDTEENWNKATNFIPKNGELIVYGDKNRLKIGDGSTTVSNLPFIENGETGGRNLAQETWFIRRFQVPTAVTMFYWELTDYGKEKLSTIGTEVIISFEARSDVAGVDIRGPYIRKYNSEANSSSPTCTAEANTPGGTDYDAAILTTEWTKYTFKRVINAVDSNIFGLRVQPNDSLTGTHFYIRNVKIEIGRNQTDYSWAPEDTYYPNENLVLRNTENRVVSKADASAYLPEYALSEKAIKILKNKRGALITYSIDVKSGVNNPNDLEARLYLRDSGNTARSLIESIYLPNDNEYHTYTGYIQINARDQEVVKIRPIVVATGGNVDDIYTKDIKLAFCSLDEITNIGQALEEKAEGVRERITSETGYSNYRALLTSDTSMDPDNFSAITDYGYPRGFRNLYVKPSIGTIYANNFKGNWNGYDKDDFYSLSYGTNISSTYIRENLSNGEGGGSINYQTFIEGTDVAMGDILTPSSVTFADGDTVRISFQVERTAVQEKGWTIENEEAIYKASGSDFPIEYQLNDEIEFIVDNNGFVSLYDGNDILDNTYYFSYVKVEKVEIVEGQETYSLSNLITPGNYYCVNTNAINLLNDLPTGFNSTNQYFILKIFKPYYTTTDTFVQQLTIVPSGSVFWRRCNSSGSWNKWNQPTILVASTSASLNLNTLIDPAIYQTNTLATVSNILNKPLGVYKYFIIKIEKMTSNNQIKQTVIDVKGNTYVRYTEDAGVTWSDWLAEGEIEDILVDDSGNIGDSTNNNPFILQENKQYHFVGSVDNFYLTTERKTNDYVQVYATTNSYPNIRIQSITGATYIWQNYTVEGGWKDTNFSSSITINFNPKATEARDGFIYRCKITLSNGQAIYSKPVILNTADTYPAADVTIPFDYNNNKYYFDFYTGSTVPTITIQTFDKDKNSNGRTNNIILNGTVLPNSYNKVEITGNYGKIESYQFATT